MREWVERVSRGGDLGPEEVEAAVAALVDDGVDDGLKGAFLKGLHEKGETAREIAAFAAAMLGRAVDPEIDPGALPGPLLDVCGTGGDKLGLFNVSTTVMFVAAAAGAVVVKHGNRGITSRCGGADVLEELGVRIDLGPSGLRACVEEAGLGFVFAPAYHPAFRAIVPVRRQLAERGIPTVFNILGPLLNPARPARQMVGVFSEGLVGAVAGALRELGRERAWVVHGRVPPDRGMDEVSPVGVTAACEVLGETVRAFEISPGAFPEPVGGLVSGEPEEVLAALRGGGPEENAESVLGLLGGGARDARRGMVLLNAGAALVAAGLAEDLAGGVALAEERLDSGAAMAKLRALRSFSERFSEK